MSIETAVFGGGCFWCLDSVFRRVKGVQTSLCAYAGGENENPSYEQICTGRTGHAEVVRLSFDNDIVDYHTLLKILFSIHDPTTLNRQGNDTGTQYRSVIFYENEQQRQESKKFIKELEDSATYKNAIVTQIKALPTLYQAEPHHQDYFNNNPHNGYCQMMIPPKLVKVAEYFDDK